MGMGIHAIAMVAVLFLTVFPGYEPEVSAPPRLEHTMHWAQTEPTDPPPETVLTSDALEAAARKPVMEAARVSTADASWYAKRNADLRMFMLRYDPDMPLDEIDRKVQGLRFDPDKPMVALTFDDGPVSGVTDQILDILEQYNARATFFVCGWRFGNEEARLIARRALALGCEIGNHTFDHHDMQKQNIVEKRQEVIRTNEAVFSATGYVMHELRPPGGHTDWDVNCVARENGMAVVLWSQSGNVHEYEPVKIAQNVQKQIVDGKELKNGDIVLLHDTKPHMVDAVAIIVPQLIEQGYQLVTVWELLNCSEGGFVPGTTYPQR